LRIEGAFLGSTSSGSATKASKNPDNLPDPDVLAQKIIEELEAALEQFREIAADFAAEVLIALRRHIER
jgi:hypothetical protein